MRLLAPLVAAVAASLLLAAPAAHASCAGPPKPSPHAFVGTVIEAEADGRVATVVRDDGARVEVHGSPTPHDGAVTSVDRRFAVGGRYEFHPVNARSPFEDNACTATRQLAGPTPPPPDPARDRLPAWLPVDEQSGPLGYAALAGSAGLALGLLAVGVRRLTRRRRTRSASATSAAPADP